MNLAKPKGSTTADIDWLRILRGYLFFACLGIWVARWVLTIPGHVRFESNYFYWALRSRYPLESLRALHASYDSASSDFYRILKICDQILPLGEELQIILPVQQQNKFEFLREKARYFLYPRNYGDNAIRKDYILVYQVNNFYRPEGYETLVTFAPDKYLLTNRTF